MEQLFNNYVDFYNKLEKVLLSMMSVISSFDDQEKKRRFVEEIRFIITTRVSSLEREERSLFILADEEEYSIKQFIKKSKKEDYSVGGVVIFSEDSFLAYFYVLMDEKREKIKQFYRSKRIMLQNLLTGLNEIV